MNSILIVSCIFLHHLVLSTGHPIKSKCMLFSLNSALIHFFLKQVIALSPIHSALNSELCASLPHITKQTNLNQQQNLAVACNIIIHDYT